MSSLHQQPINNDDKNAILESVQENGLNLCFVNPIFRKDRDVVRAAIEENSLALEYASDEILSTDEELVRIALEKSGMSWMYVKNPLRKNKNLALLSLKTMPGNLKGMDSSLRNDKDIVETAVSLYPESFQYASDDLRQNIDFIYHLLMKVSLVSSPVHNCHTNGVTVVSRQQCIWNCTTETVQECFGSFETFISLYKMKHLIFYDSRFSAENVKG